MSSAGALNRTPMHDRHVKDGARMVDFAGWHMPVQYSGVIDEHMTVRKAAGLFDVSHMGEAFVRGAQALDFLQHVTCNDVSRLKPGRAHYTAVTTHDGAFVDDLLIYHVDDHEYMLVLNAANAAKDLSWLREHAAGYEVEVEDQSSAWALMALQGPQTVTILAPLVDQPIEPVRYYRFLRASVDGVSCIVSRTGYTGEDGFEIYAPADHGAPLWSKILDAGQAHGIKPIGLAARDTLRLEAKMALYGNDIDETTTVLEADLGWIVKLGKGDFIGREALERQQQQGIERKLIGFEMQGRAIPAKGIPCRTRRKADRRGD